MLKKIISILITAAFLGGCRSSKDIKNTSTDVTYPSYDESTVSEITDSGTDNTSTEIYTVSQSDDNSENSLNRESKPKKTESSKKEETETASKAAISHESSTALDDVKSNSSNEALLINDSVWISNRVLEILNLEREAIGKNRRTALPGLREIAVFRAKQLVTRFSHSWTDDEGKKWDGAQYAATFFKYGKYFDWAQVGCPELASQNYYSYGGGENIYSGEIAFRPKEEIAQSIVDRFKLSTEHWNSLMSNKYNYDGIGVVFNNDTVYCSINSSYENYG